MKSGGILKLPSESHLGCEIGSASKAALVFMTLCLSFHGSGSRNEGF